MIPQFGMTFSLRPAIRRLACVAILIGPAAAAAAHAETAAEKSADDVLAEKTAADARSKLPDPLKGTPQMSPTKTGQEANKILVKMSKPRSDSWADWYAPLEPLHRCGEPRALPPCVPPPPCHPSLPPVPYDLIGMRGEPSCGPIYGGPCQPRTGGHDHCDHPYLHGVQDRFFDYFYKWK